MNKKSRTIQFEPNQPYWRLALWYVCHVIATYVLHNFTGMKNFTSLVPQTLFSGDETKTLQRFLKFLQQPTKTEVRSHVTLRMVIGYLLRNMFWNLWSRDFHWTLGVARTSEAALYRVTRPSVILCRGVIIKLLCVTTTPTVISATARKGSVPQLFCCTEKQLANDKL